MYPVLKIKITYNSFLDPICYACSSHTYTFTVKQKYTVARYVGEIFHIPIFLLFPGYFYHGFN